MLKNKWISLFSGMLCGLIFAPVYFLLGLLAISFLAAQIKNAPDRYKASVYGYFFGLGFYLISLYWISFGVSVYAEEFWWFIPFALIGLPAFIALFTSIFSLLIWNARNSQFYHFFFCIFWVFFEWVISWIFTGFPWSLAGYAFGNFPTMTQLASITGVYGLSFVAVYCGAIAYNLFIPKAGSQEQILTKTRLFTALLMLLAINVYGYTRLNAHQTEYSNVIARIVQPSIPQIIKWEPEAFWNNLNQYIALSKLKPELEREPDIIIWPEAALTAPYDLKPVSDAIMTIFTNTPKILITGTVSDNGKPVPDLQIYSSMIGLNEKGQKVMEYHKSHLVPFGEYVPFKNLLPVKKLTHGLLDYSKGIRKTVTIESLNLVVLPLICYESIFFDELLISNKDADLIINITNDSWYANSSGPYQHFAISTFRAIENGLPMVRVSSNGISAFIDPVGRVIEKTKLNEVIKKDLFIPKKLPQPTFYSNLGKLALIIFVILVLLLDLTAKKVFK